ncbi:unnamed protein product [Nesidiocoris tenuis]|uniref:Uncharacterized protein n=1 Tax=Nesidiocoris tenuis TaxID=355587 RepID=A0A6H5HE47_9HEMI|nr:unnamed protein product [Nesidiocoris tenuis]
MLEPIRHSLDFQRIILASTSPRRSEVLRHLGLHFEILPSLFEENLNPKDFASPADYAVETAYRKVLDVAERVANDVNKADIIVGADTVVCLDGKLYEKPKDTAAAVKFLSELSGRQHTVYTGMVIKTPNATVKFSEKTLVTMAYLSDDVIQGYVRTREPMDKAGAYGIQGLGGTLIEKIDGDFYNVLGLPLHSFCKHLLWLYDDQRKKDELKRDIGEY